VSWPDRVTIPHFWKITTEEGFCFQFQCTENNQPTSIQTHYSITDKNKNVSFEVLDIHYHKYYKRPIRLTVILSLFYL